MSSRLIWGKFKTKQRIFQKNKTKISMEDFYWDHNKTNTFTGGDKLCGEMVPYSPE